MDLTWPVIYVNGEALAGYGITMIFTGEFFFFEIREYYSCEYFKR